MKYLVVLSCVLAVTYGISPELMEQMKAQMIELGGQCKTEVGASDDDLAPLLNHQPPQTHTAKCFVACINKKMGFQDAAGIISKEGTYAWLNKLKALDADLYGKMKQVVENCLAEVSDASDECETAANVIVCVKKEEKAVGLQDMDVNS